MALDEIERAHRRVGGKGPGRRYATEQINHAYAVLMSSQFQGFCRDLHDECVDSLVQLMTPARLQTTIHESLVRDRKLDRGNPSSGNTGSDYNRLGIFFWDEVKAFDSRTPSRQSRLEDLNKWRNAIAHQDFDPSVLGTAPLQLRRVKGWRSACEGIASSFDEIMRIHIQSVIGQSPW